MNNKRYDAIVVGGGHNGLSAACYLAQEGKQVLVVESLDKVGGMATSGYVIPGAPEHLVHTCALDLMSLRVHPMMPLELGLARHGFEQVELTPGYVYLHPDGQSLVFWRDPLKTAAEIRRYSAVDANAFLEFMKVLDAFMDMAVPMMRVDPARTNLGAKLTALRAVLKNRKLKPEIMSLMSGSALQATKERFRHPVVVSAMCCLTGAAGPIMNDGTGIYFALLGFLHRFGVGRVVGGMHRLTQAMAGRLQELGGEILTSTQVVEIISEAGRAQGVRLGDGRVIEADAVVASIHPKMALEMVTPGAIDHKLMTRVAMAPANAHGASPLKVDMALRGQVGVRRHEALRPDGLSLRKCVLLIGTEEAVLENFRASARGEVPTLPYMWITAPSAVDPMQAPAGQDVAYLYPVAMPVNPRDGWDTIRDRVADQVVAQASAYMDGLDTLEIGRRVEAAPDLARRLNVHNGCVVHVDTSAMRSGAMRPAVGLGGDTLPVAGLFLGGAGIHPGGGVNGLPGRIAAGRVQRYLAKAPRQAASTTGSPERKLAAPR